MAHKVIDGRVVVDWTTGDPEGDRITLLAAYRDFIKEIDDLVTRAGVDPIDTVEFAIREIFEKWQVSTDNQIDEVPRIWIKRFE